MACLSEEFAWDSILLFKTVSFLFRVHFFFLHTLNSLANSWDRLDNWPRVPACLLICLSTDTVDLVVIQVLRRADIKKHTIHGLTKGVLIMPNHEQLPKCFRTLWKGQCVCLHVQASTLCLGVGTCGCVFTRSTVTFESLSVLMCKCDQKKRCLTAIHNQLCRFKSMSQM